MSVLALLDCRKEADRGTVHLVLTRGENIDGTRVPQANRIDKLLDRVRAACAGDEGWPAHDARDTAYYTQACHLLGLLDDQGQPTAAGHALNTLNGDSALAALALHVEASEVGAAWLSYCGARGLRELDESSALPFLLARSNLSPSTAARRAATLRQWLAALQAHAPAVSNPYPLPGAAVAFLHQELDARLPTRMLNWAGRNGVRTFRELLAWTPAQLKSEKNLGRGSVAQTAALIEAASTLSWEAWHRALRLGNHHADTLDSEGPGDSTNGLPWDTFRSRLPEWMQTAPVEVADLPTRMRNYCAREGIHTIGALVAIPHANLLDTKNLGRKSVRETREALEAMLARGHTGAEGDTAVPALADYNDVFALLRSELKRLPPTDRLIVSHRAGLHGAASTLSDIGEMLGVSRERVRQLEVRAFKTLAGRWWCAPLRSALEAHLQQGACTVAELARDAFFTPVQDQTEEFDYFLDRLYGDDLSIVQVDGQPILLTGARREVEEAEAELLRAVRQLSFPVPEALVLALAPRFAGPIAPGLAPHFAEALRARLVVADGPHGRVVTGVGHTLVNTKLAYLEASVDPVPVSELEARFGRGALPDEAIFVARGLVSLPKHVPDFYLWQRRLVPLCVAVMSAGDPTRQWSTPQLIEEIEDQVQLPGWLGHWHLASMLRLSDAVDYRGRLRVALPNTGSDQERVHMSDAAREALLEHGAPMPVEHLTARLVGTGAKETSTSQMLGRLPFVRVDSTHVGLADRDLPGGLEAIPAAVAALEAELEEQQEGLAPVEALDTVQALGEPYRQWTSPMVLSVARSMGTLRTTAAGAIGLAEWDRERIPTFRSLLEEQLRIEGGKAQVDALMDTIEARFGARPTRASLNSISHGIGARLEGAFILSASRASATTPPPPLSLPDPAAIPGFPLMAAATFSDFLREPVGDIHALVARANAYVAEFEVAQQDNEFIDPDEARALAAASATLLQATANDPNPNRRQLAWAAVRYFECPDDGDNDFLIGGLDDDAAVMNAVALYLDLPQCTVAWT